jgi:hypothetical protein
MTDVEQRPRFYEGQFLEAGDLTAAVDYSRSQLARTQLGAHTWGIALGLDLREVPGPNNTLDVFVQPGYAWDGFGRPILVPEPAKISGGLFAAFDADFVPGNPPPPPRTVEVWIRYDETMAKGPRPGFETCDATSAFARVLETFRIEVGLKPQIQDRRDPIEIFGLTFDAAQALKTFDPLAPELVDASVPHQTLPDAEDAKRWFVPLGVVSWQPGNPGSFKARDAALLTLNARSRRYCGVVAEAVEATAGHVRVHDRAKPYSAFFTEELMWVEGDLRMDGHARLYGKRLELVNSHAENPRAPFYLLRADDPGTGKKKMQLVIGDQSAGANRLAIGQQTAPDVYAEHLVVTDQGRVGIGTSEPKVQLHMKEDGLQIGTSLTAEDNFHIKSDTDGGPRALRIYNKDFGAGTHLASFTQAGRLGVGTPDPTNILHVNGNLGIRQNALYFSGDPRWSSLTFNAHHNAANNAWVFPDPSKPAMTIEMDAIEGPPRFEVFSTVVGDNQSWTSRLKVMGHSGDVGMAAAGGNVGIGTYTPLAKLDVRGDLRVSGEIQFGPSLLRPVAAPTGLRMIWGNVNDNGSLANGEGFTVSRIAAGRYQINFSPAFLSRPTVVVTKVYQTFEFDAGTAVEPRQNAVVDQLTSTFVIIATANDAGDLEDSNFCFMAVGPR